MAPLALLNVIDHLNSSLVEDIIDSAESNVSSIASSFDDELDLFITKSGPVTKEEFLKAINTATNINKTAVFETFNTFHMECASPLIEVFYKLEATNLDAALKFAKKYANSSLINFAICVILRHRKDAKEANIQVPSHVCTNPEMYFDMCKINDQVQVQDTKSAILVEVTPNFSATDLDPEHRVAYYREDIGINLHHRHWHEVYPFQSITEIVNKDRRGELFYYMHQQILARYNFERLCNNMQRAKAYSDFRVPIEEAYFPKLDTASKTKLWCPRQANAILKDLYRDDKASKLRDLEHWRDRLYDAIDRGYVFARSKGGKEQKIRIDEKDFINELGNTVEATPDYSWNFQYYGQLHNMGHLFISYCHDPDFRFRETGSVMSQSEAALRDPMFYRWHAFIDDLFQRYKGTLPPYTLQEREFPGIQIDSVQIQSDNVDGVNIFNTFWQKDTVDITQGILHKDPKDFGTVFATFTHLQHQEFTYTITINNTNQVEKTGTIRIFYAPKYDETKTEMTFNTQRKLFIELDKFTTTLKVGPNTVQRKSTAASVTIPFKQSFMTVEEAKEHTGTEKNENTTENTKNEENISNDISYCGCGLPQHLLIGKGDTAGYKCVLFVMITDYDQDKVADVSMDTVCCVKSAVSYCGVRDKLYPDKRAMGFPFDRNITANNATLVNFMTKNQTVSRNESPKILPEDDEPLPNMKVIDVTIKFKEETIDGPSVSSVIKKYPDIKKVEE